MYTEDDYQCQNCGREGGPNGDTELHAHHIVPKSRGGIHAKSNLITVCEDCHSAIHDDTAAPPTEHRDADRWTELTGQLIDDSKRLLVRVDTHVGRVIEYVTRHRFLP